MQTEKVNVTDLHLDLMNPRLPEERIQSEEEAVALLRDLADLNELVESIGNSGWQDFEPPIVVKGTMVVAEGNRRLAALKVLRDKDLARRTGIQLPNSLHKNSTPEKILVNFVENSNEARDFIGFKHVNGAQKWDSYAKARFAAKWLKDGDSVESISRRLGDSHNTVGRLVNGIQVLDQAESENLFQRGLISKKKFYFSHLYSALPHKTVRDFLGLPESQKGSFETNPVPRHKFAELKELMAWIYGQEDQPAVIKQQNPDLRNMVAVLGSEQAMRTLRKTLSLSKAYEEIEDRSERFRNAFFGLQDAISNVQNIVPKYDPRDELLQSASDLEFSLKQIISGMKSIHERSSE